MARPRKTNRIQVTVAPQINRFVHAECQRCGHESAWCASIVFRYGNGKLDAAKLTCARCRLQHDGHWAIHPKWQGAANLVMEAKNLRPGEWKQWAKDNPPLTEKFED